MAPPLSVIKIVKYCGVRGGGSLRALKSYKDNGAPSHCHQDKYCAVWGGGGGGSMGGAKILQKIMAPPLSVIKIEQYCGPSSGVVGSFLLWERSHGIMVTYPIVTRGKG